MANEEQLTILRQGVEVWNDWRKKNPDAKIDLKEADLYNADLDKVDLSKADLEKASLENAKLYEADLTQANLVGANLMGSKLIEANLLGANLNQAKLFDTDFSYADLSETDLTGATLAKASLVGTKVNKSKLSGSWIYAVNVWDLEGEFEEQKDLVITRKGQPEITVDNIKVAQFIFLLLENADIRDVINTLTSKSVLILGRFTPERKAVLDALRNRLREYNLLPILFDFDRPTDKDFTETIRTLASISYFVIADVTNPKSSPLELQATVPDYQIPFVPIIQEGEQPFAMMVDLQKKYNWVLPTKSYDSIETLMQALKPGIIDPAVEMRNKLRIIKAQEHPTESLRDYLDKSL
jgi:uncharacterized protein YjbI with pentapeptide repeats